MEVLRNLNFPSKVSQRLALVVCLLIFLVIVGGGASLYLAYSISTITERVKKESDRIHIVGKIHYTLHHLTGALQRAALGVEPFTEEQRKVYLDEVRESLRQYQPTTGNEAHATTPLWESIRALDSTSKSLVTETNTPPGNKPGIGRLSELTNIELSLMALIHSLGGIHRSSMEKTMAGSAWRMRLLVQLYVGFVIAALLLLMGASWFFSRTISRPLRALADATLEVAAGNLNKNLSVRSKDEIGQLGDAFNVMVQRLNENREQLQGLATVAERERLARELHDTIAQDLALMQIKISEAEMELSPNAPESTQTTLNELRQIVTSAYDDVRQAIFGLRTMVAKGLGFIPALTEYLHEFSEVRKISVHLKIFTKESIQLSAQAEIQLIHIISEALTNIFKHAQAHEGTVSFDRVGQYVKVTVEDQGRGFQLDGAGNGFHMGLKAMRERAELVGGKLSVESAPGEGTRVITLLPLKTGSYGNDSNSLSR